jgi:hypothetical protein
MTGPDDDFRGRVADIARELTSEAALEGLLGEIDQAVQADVERGPGESADDDLAAIESWTSVASYAAARFYAPASPWPRDLAGWGNKAVGQLRKIANTLSEILRGVAQALKAASFSIAVGFPWGISVGLSW